MAEKISYREFGRRVGMSAEGVRKAIATGRIPAEYIGELTLRTGRKRPCIANPDAAEAALNELTNPLQQRDRAKISRSMEKAHARRRGEAVPDDDGDDEPAGTGTAQDASGIPSIAKSNAIKAAYQARLAKLEYEERSGKLVSSDAVKVKVVNMVKAAQTKLRGVPTKAKTRIPTLTVSDIEILEDLIDEALQELADGR